MGDEWFFRDLADFVNSKKGRANHAQIENRDVVADEDCIRRVKDVFKLSACCVLVGPRDSGKTFSALILGSRLRLDDHWVAFYGDARELKDASTAAREIRSYGSFAGPALFILENCHTNLGTVNALLDRLPPDMRNVRLLLTTRQLGDKDEPLGTLYEEGCFATPRPEGLRGTLVRRRVNEVRAAVEYRNAPHIPADETALQYQLNRLLLKLPRKNLRILALYLRAWDPRKEPLDAVNDAAVFDSLLLTSHPKLDSPLALKCLLPLYAVGQFEVGVHGAYLEPQGLAELESLGLISKEPLTGTCHLQESSEAVWYLGAAEQAGLLSLGGSVALGAYVKHHVIEYGAVCPNPHGLLRGVREDDPDLAKNLLADERFRSNVRGLLTSRRLLSDFPSLLMEAYRLRGTDVWQSLATMLDDTCLDDVASADLSTFTRYLTVFWQCRPASRTISSRLVTRKQSGPKELGLRVRDALSSGELSVGQLAWLLSLLNSLRTYDVAGLCATLDLKHIRSLFALSRTTSYAALLRQAKGARIGISALKVLMPDVDAWLERVKKASLRHLRDVMDAQFMQDRKALWQRLATDDLDALLGRSTLNQCCNLLEDALESRNRESTDLGKLMAARLLGRNLGPLIQDSGLKDLGMFSEEVLGLDIGLADNLWAQIRNAGLSRVVEAESDKDQVIRYLSYLIRNFLESPKVEASLVADVLQLNLEQQVKRSQPEGLRWFIYQVLWADESKAREWCLSMSPGMWESKIKEASPREAHYLLWNLYQAAESLAEVLAQLPSVATKLNSTIEGIGLLSLCGAAPVVSASAAFGTKALLSGMEPAYDPKVHPARFALALKALCHPSNGDLAVALRQRTDMSELARMFESANMPKCSKHVLLAILAEFDLASERGSSP